MCLIVLAVGQQPDLPLVLAANRDEFHRRPARAAHWWNDKPDILGGRDLQAGGTWLALHRNGRFATVTNYRDAQPPAAGFRSRGELVTGFLESGLEPLAFVNEVDEEAYAGFNLIVGDGSAIAYLSNREPGHRQLGNGIYGLSNALLDGDWHKVRHSRQQLQELFDDDNVNETSLLRLLADRQRAPASDIESGDLGFSKAHAISAPFITLPDYGTRCSTTVMMDAAGCWRFFERRFDPTGKVSGESRFAFAAGA